MPPEQNRISRAVWPWPDKAPDPSALRRKSALRGALLHSALLTISGAGATLLLNWKSLGIALAAAGGSILILGLILPGAYHHLSRFGLGLGRFVGHALAWILLTPFYLTVFVAGRLILILRGRDPLSREFGGDAQSYWIDRKPSGRSGRYERQY